MSGLRTHAAVRASSHRELALASGGKRCAATACTERVTVGRIFCREHWFMIPRWLRDAIKSTFFDAEWAAHIDAIRQASDHIDALRDKARGQGCSVTSAFEHGEPVVYMGRRL